MEQQQKMDKKSKIFFFIFFSALVIATIFSYRRHMVFYDYPVDNTELLDEETE